MLVGTLFYSVAEKSLVTILLPLHLSPKNQRQTGEAVLTGDVVRFCILTYVPYTVVYTNVIKLCLFNPLGWEIYFNVLNILTSNTCVNYVCHDLGFSVNYCQ